MRLVMEFLFEISLRQLTHHVRYPLVGLADFVNLVFDIENDLDEDFHVEKQFAEALDFYRRLAAMPDP